MYIVATWDESKELGEPSHAYRLSKFDVALVVVSSGLATLALVDSVTDFSFASVECSVDLAVEDAIDGPDGIAPASVCTGTENRFGS